MYARHSQSALLRSYTVVIYELSIRYGPSHFSPDLSSKCKLTIRQKERRRQKKKRETKNSFLEGSEEL